MKWGASACLQLHTRRLSYQGVGRGFQETPEIFEHTIKARNLVRHNRVLRVGLSNALQTTTRSILSNITVKHSNRTIIINMVV